MSEGELQRLQNQIQQQQQQLQQNAPGGWGPVEASAASGGNWQHLYGMQNVAGSGTQKRGREGLQELEAGLMADEDDDLTADLEGLLGQMPNAPMQTAFGRPKRGRRM
mmetsp:Transcript_33426/g.72953  ORF Transcript_33426/g.72953 Transcript_33426/m.72953 type:complete len:108 (+) Transcript_33426:750-1073(+)